MVRQAYVRRNRAPGDEGSNYAAYLFLFRGDVSEGERWNGGEGEGRTKEGHVHALGDWNQESRY